MVSAVSLLLNLLLLLLFVFKNRKINKSLSLLDEKIKLTARNPRSAQMRYKNNSWGE